MVAQALTAIKDWWKLASAKLCVATLTFALVLVGISKGVGVLVPTLVVIILFLLGEITCVVTARFYCDYTNVKRMAEPKVSPVAASTADGSSNVESVEPDSLNMGPVTPVAEATTASADVATQVVNT